MFLRILTSEDHAPTFEFGTFTGVLGLLAGFFIGVGGSLPDILNVNSKDEKDFVKKCVMNSCLNIC